LSENKGRKRNGGKYKGGREKRGGRERKGKLCTHKVFKVNAYVSQIL